jgi:hypothetical protein
MVKISDAGSGLAFADYCATREDAILFCLTQAQRFPDTKTAAWVDQLLPEERPRVWIAGRDMDWELVDKYKWGLSWFVRPLLAAAIVLGAQSMRTLVSGSFSESSAWLLAAAVIASAALLGIGAGAVSVVTATLTSDFFDICPIQSLTLNVETLRIGFLYAVLAFMAYLIAKRVQKLIF